MRLSSLLGPDSIADSVSSIVASSTEIEGISADSRSIRPGYLFAAMPGSRADGGKFIADAISKGAVSLLVAEGVALPTGVTIPVIRSNDVRRSLAVMAARYFGLQPAVCVAVTGTSGKTSVAEFTRQIFAHLGHRAASLGTIGVVKPDGAVYGSLTTPDPVSLHETLASLAREGVTHLAFEASSHGLDQRRLDGVKLTAAAFTNLGRDHMDYHPTVEHYFGAKLRLFTELLRPGQTAVINLEDAAGARVRDAAVARGAKLITVGPQGQTLRLTGIERNGFTQKITVEHEGRSYDVNLPLIGAYQVLNALVAAGLAMAIGEQADRVLAALAHLRGVRGRLDIVAEWNGGLAVVDYAHKPEALIAALDACRPFATGNLICVFGCGGDRDKGKRPIMGEIAQRQANITIVTDDNPRTEDAAQIRAEILAGAKGALEIGDRAEAIRTAIDMIKPGDVVLVAGKGHETGQIVGNTVLPFSDHDEILQAMKRAHSR